MYIKYMLSTLILIITIQAERAQISGITLDTASMLVLQGKNAEAGKLFLKRVHQMEDRNPDSLTKQERNLFFSNLYSLVCCYAKTGKPDSALYFLKMLADRNYSHIELSADVDLEPLQTYPSWQRSLDKIKASFLLENRTVEDPEMAMELLEIQARDQSIRMNTQIPPERARLMDENNKIRIGQIIDATGYPTAVRVGLTASEVPVLILIHSDLSTQLKYLRAIKKSVRHKELNGEYLGILTDKIRIARGKPQLYGTQFRRDSLTGKNEAYPIKDLRHINKRRAALGFTISFEEYKSFQESY
ncbi:MAG: DUF6624 domain-containing protein [Bacteroidia bacterium]